MTKLIKTFALCLLLLGCSAEKDYNTAIITAKGEVHYNLETAATPEQQAKGLMNRTSLSKDGGMIFVINPIRRVTMWMKDTKIPLDIIFINPEAKIVKIVENATPMSEEHLVSAEPVRAVIEISGGSAKNTASKSETRSKMPRLAICPPLKQNNKSYCPKAP